MTTNKVDFRAITATVLEDFSCGFTDMVVQFLEQRNTVMTAADGKKRRCLCRC